MLELKEREIVLPTVPGPARKLRRVDAAHLGRSDATQRDPNGVYRDLRQVLPSNPWSCRLRLSGTQSLASGGALVTIPFDVVDYDPSNSYNTTTHQWTAPIAGRYKMVGKANITSGAGLKWFLIVVRFYANGNRLTEGVQVNAGDFTGTAGTVLNTGYDTMTDDAPYLNAGDLVDLRVTQQNDVANALTLNAGLFTYAVIHLLSG